MTGRVLIWMRDVKNLLIVINLQGFFEVRRILSLGLGLAKVEHLELMMYVLTVSK